MIESKLGKGIEVIPHYLGRHKNGDGGIPSEAEVLKHLAEGGSLEEGYCGTSTICLTEGTTVQLILPYETNSSRLTETAETGLKLIDSNRRTVDGCILLDKNYGNGFCEGEKEELEPKGIYTHHLREWFKMGGNGRLIGLNRPMNLEEARECPFVLTKLGHPKHVHAQFARPEEEVYEIIKKLFELGKMKGLDEMMEQGIPGDVRDRRLLNIFYVNNDVEYGVSSTAGVSLEHKNGRIAFDRGIREKDNWTI